MKVSNRTKRGLPRRSLANFLVTLIFTHRIRTSFPCKISTRGYATLCWNVQKFYRWWVPTSEVKPWTHEALLQVIFWFLGLQVIASRDPILDISLQGSLFKACLVLCILLCVKQCRPASGSARWVSFRRHPLIQRYWVCCGAVIVKSFAPFSNSHLLSFFFSVTECITLIKKINIQWSLFNG